MKTHFPSQPGALSGCWPLTGSSVLGIPIQLRKESAFQDSSTASEKKGFQVEMSPSQG